MNKAEAAAENIEMADNTPIEIVGSSVQYAGRDMVLVKLGEKLQPFYRSTGRNSKKPGTWFPFDGTRNVGWIMGWIDKAAYCFVDDDHPLQRFGTEDLKGVSVQLGELNLPVATTEVDADGVNRWIAEHRNELAKAERECSCKN